MPKFMWLLANACFVVVFILYGIQWPIVYVHIFVWLWLQISLFFFVCFFCPCRSLFVKTCCWKNPRKIVSSPRISSSNYTFDEAVGLCRFLIFVLLIGRIMTQPSGSAFFVQAVSCSWFVRVRICEERCHLRKQKLL